MITGHVPPGYTTPRAVRWMFEKFNKKFVDIVLRHSDVITAMHFGHEHHDNFRLFYNSSGKYLVKLKQSYISHVKEVWLLLHFGNIFLFTLTFKICALLLKLFQCMASDFCGPSLQPQL